MEKIAAIITYIVQLGALLFFLVLAVSHVKLNIFGCFTPKELTIWTKTRNISLILTIVFFILVFATIATGNFTWWK